MPKSLQAKRQEQLGLSHECDRVLQHLPSSIPADGGTVQGLRVGFVSSPVAGPALAGLVPHREQGTHPFNLQGPERGQFPVLLCPCHPIHMG